MKNRIYTNDPDLAAMFNTIRAREERRARIVIWTLATLGVIGLLWAYTGEAAAARPQVDNAVVFIADMSVSMDDEDRRIVRESHAMAISSPEVLTAIRAGANGRSAFAYIEFADRAEVVVSWTIIDGPANAVQFASAIMEDRPSLGSSTGIGNALVAASGLILDMPFEALFITVDVAGDGKSNTGAPAMAARDLILSSNATINGMPMVIRSVERDLSDWYAANVIGGPRAFSIELNRIEDMPMMMRRKLIMELF